MHLRASLTKFWAYSSMLLVTGIILFLFGYVFTGGRYKSAGNFVPAAQGAVLGGGRAESGLPLWELVLYGDSHCPGGIPCCRHSTFMVFYCKGRRTAGLIRMVIQCISGNPAHCPGTVCLQLPWCGIWPGGAASCPPAWLWP